MIVSCFMKTSSSSDGSLLRADDTDRHLIGNLHEFSVQDTMYNSCFQTILLMIKRVNSGLTFLRVTPRPRVRSAFWFTGCTAFRCVVAALRETGLFTLQHGTSVLQFCLYGTANNRNYVPEYPMMAFSREVVVTTGDGASTISVAPFCIFWGICFKKLSQDAELCSIDAAVAIPPLSVNGLPLPPCISPASHDAVSFFQAPWPDPG